MNYGILLAAGFGKRYASLSQGENKLLASLADGQTVAQASARALKAAVDEVIAVVRPNSHELAALLQQQGCTVIETTEKSQAMGLSLATAARHIQQRPAFCSETDAVVVALADMPWIASNTYLQVLSALASERIVAPIFEGKRGHPVGFQASLLAELAQLNADTGAKSIIAKYGVKLIATNDPGVLQDIDFPTDLLPP